MSVAGAIVSLCYAKYLPFLAHWVGPLRRILFCRILGTKPLSIPMLVYYKMEQKVIKWAKYDHFLSQKCIRKCWRSNIWHIVRTSMSYSREVTTSLGVLLLWLLRNSLCGIPWSCWLLDDLQLRTNVIRGRSKNVSEFSILRAPEFPIIYNNPIFQCMGKIFCVEFHRISLEFHTKYVTHTLKIV